MNSTHIKNYETNYSDLTEGDVRYRPYVYVRSNEIVILFILSITFFLCTSELSANVFKNQEFSHRFGPTESFPRWSAGIGAWGMNQRFSNGDTEVIFRGGSLHGQFTVFKYLALQSEVYYSERNDSASQSLFGVEGSLLLGTNWGRGSNFFIGGGFFTERLEDDRLADETVAEFQGSQISGGYSYQWTSGALEFRVSRRDPSEYQNFFDDPSEITAIVGSVLVSFRF